MRTVGDGAGWREVKIPLAKDQGWGITRRGAGWLSESLRFANNPPGGVCDRVTRSDAYTSRVNVYLVLYTKEILNSRFQ